MAPLAAGLGAGGLGAGAGPPSGDRIRIEVEDQAEGPHQGASTKGSGLALQTLRKRLDQQYEGRATLQLSSQVQGTLVTVELPKDTDIIGELG